jgi:membrane-bound metal-dependent hydrolase YbcI (DUF457 family)
MFSGGKALCFWMLFMTFLSRALTVASTLWLSAWTTNSLDLSQKDYINYYALISIFTGLLIFIAGMLFNSFARASANSLQ